MTVQNKGFPPRLPVGANRQSESAPPRPTESAGHHPPVVATDGYEDTGSNHLRARGEPRSAASESATGSRQVHPLLQQTQRRLAEELVGLDAGVRSAVAAWVEAGCSEEGLTRVQAELSSVRPAMARARRRMADLRRRQSSLQVDPSAVHELPSPQKVRAMSSQLSAETPLLERRAAALHLAAQSRLLAEDEVQKAHRIAVRSPADRRDVARLWPVASPKLTMAQQVVSPLGFPDLPVEPDIAAPKSASPLQDVVSLAHALAKSTS